MPPKLRQQSLRAKNGSVARCGCRELFEGAERRVGGIHGHEGVRAHYNQLADRYDEAWAHSEEFVGWMRVCLYERLKPTEGERALDLGCGTGLFTDALAPTEHPITAVDPSMALLAQLLQRAAPGRVYPVCASAEEIASGQEQLPEAAYDVLLAKECLHHVPPGDRDSVIAGLVRLLAPGGRMLVAMLPMRCPYPLWPAASERFTQQQPDPQDIAHAMSKAGLEVEVTHDDFPLTFPTDQYESMLRDRYMSLLSMFTDSELDEGIQWILRNHDADEVTFTDRFVFILGRKAAPA